MRLHRPLERLRRLVPAALRVEDAPEVRERVEVIVRIAIDVLEDRPVPRLGRRAIAPVVIDSAAEQQRVAEKVRVEERLIRVEERQRLLEEVQRLVEVLQRVR